MSAVPRIAFIGAGSTVFVRKIMADVLRDSVLSDADIRLMDIDAQRLAQSERVVCGLVDRFKARAQVRSFQELSPALDGADFVIVAFQIGGYEPATMIDFEIPKKYGLRQTIGDTLGIGGIMRALRTVPELWKLCAAMERLCPEALLMQYVNPMAINCWAISRAFPSIRFVGLCHSITHTVTEIAHDLDINPQDIVHKVAGINHMAFFLRLQQRLSDGSLRDLAPLLEEGYRSYQLPKNNVINPRCPNVVRYEMFLKLGYFPTESSEHFAEYTPWFIKRDRQDLIEHYQIPLDEYPARCLEQREQWQSWQTSEANGSATVEDLDEPSEEAAAPIMRAILTGDPLSINGNTVNQGCLTDLPQDSIVEVPCLVDANGIQPTRVGGLPTHLTTLIQTNIHVQQLVVDALCNEDVRSIYHAASLDPHTSAELDLSAIHGLVSELLNAHADWLPRWCVPWPDRSRVSTQLRAVQEPQSRALNTLRVSDQVSQA